MLNQRASTEFIKDWRIALRTNDLGGKGLRQTTLRTIPTAPRTKHGGRTQALLMARSQDTLDIETPVIAAIFLLGLMLLLVYGKV
jgi:hypothetical protein